MLLRLPYDKQPLSIVRIERIVMRNIKSVEYGEVRFENPRKPDGPRIVGLYGQNGSGKSTLIDILGVLRQCMGGHHVESKAAQYVDVGADVGRVECEFSIDAGGTTHIRASYCFSMASDSTPGKDGAGRPSTTHAVGTPRIFDETLSVSTDAMGELRRMTVVIDTSSPESVFGPKSKLKRLVGANEKELTLRKLGLSHASKEDLHVNLLEAKRDAFEDSRSFVFSRDLYDSILQHRHEVIVASPPDAPMIDDLCSIVIITLSTLSTFARDHIYVLSSADAGNAIAGTLALSVLDHDLSGTPHNMDPLARLMESRGVTTTLPIDGPSWVSRITHRAASNMLGTMNVVISQIIPGLTISLEQVETDEERPKYAQCYAQLVSHRDGRTIPFSCESGGVKRIFSFVNLLVLMYNDPRVLVAVDELDSGIFEYLLGELLSIVAAHGVGQMVFTSHNLRPLETIDRGYICFTTTNPRNRYLRMSNVKSTNNLRDFYYRDILLGGQREQLYDPTSNGKIELALMEAGMRDGS